MTLASTTPLQESEVGSFTQSNVAASSSGSQAEDASSPSSFPISFGRSPQCTASWQSVLLQIHSVTTETDVETLVVSGTSVTVFDIFDPGAGVTAGLTLTGPTTTLFTALTQTFGLDDSNGCCGQCFIAFAEVQVRYFPVPGSNTACLSNISPTQNGVDQIARQASATTEAAESSGSSTAAYNTITDLAITPTGNISGQSYAVGPDGFT